MWHKGSQLFRGSPIGTGIMTFRIQHVITTHPSVRLVPGGLTVCVGVCGNCYFYLKTDDSQIPSGNSLSRSKCTTS